MFPEETKSSPRGETNLVRILGLSRPLLPLALFASLCNIPQEIEFSLPGPNESPEMVREGTVARIAFPQMAPNFLRYVLSTLTVLAEAGFSPSTSKLLGLFRALESAAAGIFSLNPILDRKLIDGMPSNDGPWRKYWFFFRVNPHSVQGNQTIPRPTVDFLSFFRIVSEGETNWNSFTLQRIHKAGLAIKDGQTHPLDPPPEEKDASSLNARDNRKMQAETKALKDQLSEIGKKKRIAAISRVGSFHRKTLLVDDGSLEAALSFAVEPLDFVLPLPGDRIIPEEIDEPRPEAALSQGLSVRAQSPLTTSISGGEEVGDIFRSFQTREGTSLPPFSVWRPEIRQMFVNRACYLSQAFMETNGIIFHYENLLHQAMRETAKAKKALMSNVSELRQRIRVADAERDSARSNALRLESELEEAAALLEETNQKTELLIRDRARDIAEAEHNAREEMRGFGRQLIQSIVKFIEDEDVWTKLQSDRAELKSNLDLIEGIESGRISLEDERGEVSAELASVESELSSASRPSLDLKPFSSVFGDSPSQFEVGEGSRPYEDLEATFKPNLSSSRFRGIGDKNENVAMQHYMLQRSELSLSTKEEPPDSEDLSSNILVRTGIGVFMMQDEKPNPYFRMIFEVGEQVHVYLKRKQLPPERSSKLMPMVDGPIKATRRINANSYQLDFQGKYQVSSSFSVSNLVLSNAEKLDLRSNSFQVGEDDVILESTKDLECGNELEPVEQHGARKQLEPEDQHEPEDELVAADVLLKKLIKPPCLGEIAKPIGFNNGRVKKVQTVYQRLSASSVRPLDPPLYHSIYSNSSLNYHSSTSVPLDLHYSSFTLDHHSSTTSFTRTAPKTTISDPYSRKMVSRDEETNNNNNQLLVEAMTELMDTRLNAFFNDIHQMSRSPRRSQEQHEQISSRTMTEPNHDLSDTSTISSGHLQNRLVTRRRSSSGHLPNRLGDIGWIGSDATARSGSNVSLRPEPNAHAVPRQYQAHPRRSLIMPRNEVSMLPEAECGA
ncbi:hypothetical protein ISN44_As08g031430 [Arabidopsis suecica]|uniref:Tf2-1-like SH3-like domain-containing protein n=1 Tax=Arabidopsis suecica TaxID=45249 RepID=A0A8T2B914_ARASU|nr:hypothetical protein ISN44_As08g031430 [Arabidopsis suecica]